jgi:uncharacterized protein (TIGR03437 family)
VLGALVVLLGAVPGSAQVWDRTGNNLLSGQYFFREVFYAADGFGDVQRALMVYGVITFNAGNYSMAATALDSAVGSQNLSATGTYSISASGYGFLQHPLLASQRLMVLVSNGILLGSGTELGLNDLLVAVPLGSATNATFQGSYSMAHLNFPSGLVEDHYGTIAQLNPNGQGNIGTVATRFYVAGNGSSALERSEPGVRYSFSQGVGRIDFPLGAGLPLVGTHMLAISPNGEFIFGGSTQGFDFFLGVRRGAGIPAPFKGLYYSAGINVNAKDVANSGGAFDTFYGSIRASDGVIGGHQRYFSPRIGSAQNYTFADSYPVDPATDFFNAVSSTEFVLGADGALRIGFGRGPFLGISVAVRAPEFTGSGVFLNPTGVLNGASSAPFTAGLARGELLTLYGENLADRLVIASAAPFPPALGGVEVRINNRPAPIYYVSPTQVAVIVPFGTAEEIAQVQVFKNGTASNAVTAFVYKSAPGVFTVPPGGIGYAAVLHPDYSLVTPDNPARAGEILAVFLTGLGDVFPTIADGAPGPVEPLSRTSNDVLVFMGNKPAEVSYSGLAPTLAGLYQVNVQVPEGLTGDVYLDISVGGSYTSQALLPAAGQ